jgi:PKD repeat protein
VNFTVDNALATNPDIADFWNGSMRNYSTGAITYRPNYNVYGQAPVTVIENSLVYNEFDTAIIRNQQSIFDGESISLVALRGSLQETTGTASVNVRPVSASTTTVPVETDGSGNVTISTVSRLPPSRWNKSIAESEEFANQSEGGHVVTVEGSKIGALDGDPIYRIKFVMENGVTYDLQLARVGVGDLSNTESETNASYTVAVTDSVTTEENTNATVTVEVRDQYDNPKAGVTVNATAVGGAGGSIADSPKQTNEDGRVTFTYNTTKNVGGTESEDDTVRVSFTGDTTSGFDADAPANVTTRVTVKNTDGSGLPGGGGGGAYGITFDKAPDYDRNVTEDGSSITLVASTDPALQSVSTDFAVNNTTVATIGSEDTQTNGTGEADVTLNANANGTVAVYVGSAGSSDVINVTVTDVGAGGGSNAAPSASFTYTPSNPSTSQTVSFDASGSGDSDGSISTYEWDFDGDGTTEATGETVSHSYSDDKSYSATLTVTDNDGATATDTQTVTVSNEPPTASFTVTPSSPLVNESTEFDGTGSSDPDDPISSYEWDFGDGSPNATGVTPNHRYTSSGTYTVTLTVEDDDGATDTTTKQVTVRPLPKISAVEPDPEALDASDDGEFVRVYFPTNTDTTGWTIVDDEDDATSLPSTTLSGEIYFAKNETAFENQWGLPDSQVYPLTTLLANGGDVIELRTDRGRVIDEFGYNGIDTSNNWNLGGVDKGEVAYRKTDGSGNYLDTNSSSDWLTEDENTFFGADTASPVVSSASVENAPINYSDASGSTTQTVTVTFNESMNTNIDPTVQLMGLPNTADITVSGSWADSTTWTGEVDFPQKAEEATATISVGGAEDTAGNVQSPDPDTSNTFVVDTKRPQDPDTARIVTDPIVSTNESNVTVEVDMQTSSPESGTVYVELTGPNGNTVSGNATVNTGGQTTTITGIDASSLADGKNAISASVRVVDDYGNENPSGFISLGSNATKDTTAPGYVTSGDVGLEVTANSKGSGSSNKISSVTFDYFVEDNVEVDKIVFKVTKDSSTTTFTRSPNSATSENQFDGTLSGEPKAPVDVEVVVIDSVGNSYTCTGTLQSDTDSITLADMSCSATLQSVQPVSASGFAPTSVLSGIDLAQHPLAFDDSRTIHRHVQIAAASSTQYE